MRWRRRRTDEASATEPVREPRFKPVRWTCRGCGAKAPGRGTCEAQRLWLPEGWGTFMHVSNILCPDCYDKAEPPEWVLEFRSRLGLTDPPPERNVGRLYLDAKKRGERYVYPPAAALAEDRSSALLGLIDKITDQIER